MENIVTPGLILASGELQISGEIRSISLGCIERFRLRVSKSNHHHHMKEKSRGGPKYQE